MLRVTGFELRGIIENDHAMGNYRDMEIYELALKGSIDIRNLAKKGWDHILSGVFYQIIRSSISVYANIVEGYGRRRYKKEYIRFLIFAHASCDETIAHLEYLRDIKKLDLSVKELLEEYNRIGSKINHFINHVELKWKPLE